jgi:hypothetical protein
MCPVTLTGLAIGSGFFGGAAMSVGVGGLAVASTAGIGGAAGASIALATSAMATATALSSALSVGGTLLSLGAGIHSSMSQAKQQKRQIREKYRQQEHKNKLAKDALLLDYETANIKKMELNKVAAGKQEDIQLATAQDRATARVSAAEAGVTGLSIDSLLDSVTREGLYDANTVSSNLAMQTAQVDRSTRTSKLRYSGRADTSRFYMEDNTGSLLGALGGALTDSSGYGALA